MANLKGFTWNCERHTVWLLQVLLYAQVNDRMVPRAMAPLYASLLDEVELFLEVDTRGGAPYSIPTDPPS